MTDLSVVVCVAFDHRAEQHGLVKFKECIRACHFVEAVLEVSGTFDLIVHARLASLTEYNQEMQRIAPQLAEYANKVEANFVASKVERIRKRERTLWVPCHEGRRRIDESMINKIEAEGDYMRLHVEDWTCLLRETIHSLMERLDPDSFIQLHRSIIVRISFIERMLHRGTRWVARLRDGTEHRVAKSHVAHVIRMMTNDSATLEHGSAKGRRVIAKADPVLENPMPMPP